MISAWWSSISECMMRWLIANQWSSGLEVPLGKCRQSTDSDYLPARCISYTLYTLTSSSDQPNTAPPIYFCPKLWYKSVYISPDCVFGCMYIYIGICLIYRPTIQNVSVRVQLSALGRVQRDLLAYSSNSPPTSTTCTHKWVRAANVKVGEPECSNVVDDQLLSNVVRALVTTLNAPGTHITTLWFGAVGATFANGLGRCESGANKSGISAS